MRKYFLLFTFAALIFPSCAVLDYPKRIAGYSVQKFEKEKTGRFIQNFDLSKDEAFNRTLDILKKMRARVTHKNYKKGYIVAFDFAKSFDYCLDSTEAAFYFEETEEKNIQVTVVSDNSMLARNLSEKYFQLIKNPETKETESSELPD